MATADILHTHNPELFRQAVQRAVSLLGAGELVALPTETVYGLAANALDARAVEKIYETKGRPRFNPIIVHVSDLAMAKRCAAEWPDEADKLARAFWPGPLTIVLRRSAEIPNMVTAGGDTVAVRWPSHPLMQAVIRECGFPLAAPSANRAGEISPTNAEHVQKNLGTRIHLIIDGGQSQVGIESTVVDLTCNPPRLLRPGMIHEEALLAVTGKLSVGFGDSEEVLKSPGLLKKHYAPKAKLLILDWKDDEDLKRLISASSALQAHVIAHTKIPGDAAFARVSVIPHDAEAFARAIYAELHRCDESGASLIVVEALPQTIEWRAIADRLNRAASDDTAFDGSA